MNKKSNSESVAKDSSPFKKQTELENQCITVFEQYRDEIKGLLEDILRENDIDGKIYLMN